MCSVNEIAPAQQYKEIPRLMRNFLWERDRPLVKSHTEQQTECQNHLDEVAGVAIKWSQITSGKKGV